MQRIGIASFLWSRFGESFPHPHNAYLQWLLDNGFLGLIPVILFYFIVLKYALSLLRDQNDEMFMCAGGVCFSLVLALLFSSIGSQSFYPRVGTVGMWASIGLMLRVYVMRQKNLL